MTLDGGLILLAAAIVGLLICRVIGRRPRFGWVAAMSAVVASILVFGSLAALSLGNPHDNLLELAGWREPSPGSAENHATDTTPAKPNTMAPAEEKIDWAASLKPTARKPAWANRCGNWSPTSVRSRFRESWC